MQKCLTMKHKPDKLNYDQEGTMQLKVKMKTEDDRNVEYEVSPSNDFLFKYKVFAYNPELCNKLNKKLKQYPKTDFVSEGSEGIFKLTEADYKKVQSTLYAFRTL